jgi:Cu+-exporting ATPase
MIVLTVTGMHCDSCVKRVQRALMSVEGVKDAKVNLITSQATVEVEPDKVGPHDLGKAVRKLGFRVPEPGTTTTPSDI